MFLITKYSLSSFVTAVILVAITIYLYSRPKKTLGTWSLANYYAVLSILLISYFIRYTFLTTAIIFTGVTANLIIFGVGFFIMFAYNFHGNTHPRESRIVVPTYFIVSAVVYVSAYLLGIGQAVVFDPEAHYYTLELGSRVSIVTAIGFIWIIVLLFRKSTKFTGRLARSMVAFGILALLTFGVALLYLSSQVGLVTRDFCAFGFSIGSLLVSLAIFSVYINNSSEPASFRAKLSEYRLRCSW